MRIPDVDREVLAARRQEVEPANEVVHVAEGAGLRAVPKDRQRLVLECLAHERRNRAPVVRTHARAVGVEDPHDAGVHALLAVISHRQRFGVALRLVVDAARANRVHVAPVGLRLGMHLRIAVHLARRGEQEARALDLRQAEHVVGSIGAHLERVEREAQVVDRAGGAGQVEDEVHRLVDEPGLRQVLVDEDEVGAVLDVLDVLERARVEVVHAHHAVALLEQVVAEVRAEKTGAAGDNRSTHPTLMLVTRGRKFLL